MSATFSLVPLRDVVTPIERPEVPAPGIVLRQLGVRLWGQGAYERDSIDGGQTKYKTLFRVEADDLVVNKIWARNGSVAVVPASLAGRYVSGEFPTFLLNQHQVDPRWLHWLTQTKGFWQQCEEKSRGTSGKNRIRPEQFLEVAIPFPTIDEQRRIVARIEELAAKIEEARGLRRETLQETNRLLIAMTHRDDLDADTKREQGWSDAAISDVVTLVQDAHQVDKHLSYPNIGIYSFGRGLFRKPPISGLSTSAKTLYRVHAAQFIYSRLFAFEGAYGYVTDQFDGSFVSNEYPTFECDTSKVLPEFLYAYFKSPVVWREVAAGGGGLGDRRQRVQPDRVLARCLWIPPIPWQEKIRAVMRAADQLRSLRDATSAELDALLPSVLDKAFKGEL